MKISHHDRSGWRRGEETNCKEKKPKQNSCQQRTIDGNGDDLGEVEAVGALEGRDLAKGLDLAVLSGSVGLSLDQLQVQAVVLSSDQDGDGTTVFLKGESEEIEDSQGTRTYRETVELSESHLESKGCEWEDGGKERKGEGQTEILCEWGELGLRSNR